MWRKLLTKTDTYKRQPHDVNHIYISQVGSKYYIYADVEGMKPRVIGRYNSYDRAKEALETVRSITESNN